MYFGHLVFPSPGWLERAVSQKRGSRVALPGLKLPKVRTGDPVFCASADEKECAIQLHGRISFTEDLTAGEAWVKFGSILGAASEAEFLDQLSLPHQIHSLDERLTIWVLSVFPICPPLPVEVLSISPIPAFGVADISPLQVLEIMKALPPVASSDWTRRVVERNNDIPIEKVPDDV